MDLVCVCCVCKMPESILDCISEASSSPFFLRSLAQTAGKNKNRRTKFIFRKFSFFFRTDHGPVVKGWTYNPGSMVRILEASYFCKKNSESLWQLESFCFCWWPNGWTFGFFSFSHCFMPIYLMIYFTMGSIPHWSSHLFFISIKMVRYEEFCDYYELLPFPADECSKGDLIHSNKLFYSWINEKYDWLCEIRAFEWVYLKSI